MIRLSLGDNWSWVPPAQEFCSCRPPLIENLEPRTLMSGLLAGTTETPAILMALPPPSQQASWISQSLAHEMANPGPQRNQRIVETYQASDGRPLPQELPPNFHVGSPIKLPPDFSIGRGPLG
jgi:hypothetical protein